jgi:hypothetical protein
VLATAEPVNEAGNQLFAGAAFGFDQNIGIGGRGLPRPIDRLLPRGRVADERFRLFILTSVFIFVPVLVNILVLSLSNSPPEFAARRRTCSTASSSFSKHTGFTR